MTNFHSIVKALINVAIFAIIFSIVVRLGVLFKFRNEVFSPPSSPEGQIAVILGAGLRRDGSPTRVLADRIDAGIELFNSKKVTKIIMSGSQTVFGYDEVISMRDYAVSKGIPLSAIILDGRGFSTRETCQNLQQIGTQKVILVTQRFHLPRALLLCKFLGIDSIGVEADKPGYRTFTKVLWNLREIPATFAAFIQIMSTIK
jgi:SanA protein